MNNIRAGLRLSKRKAKPKQKITLEELQRIFLHDRSDARLDCFLHGHQWPQTPDANIRCSRCGIWASQIDPLEMQLRARLGLT